MAHPPSAKSLANLKPIKKGEIKNPHGARAHNPEMRKLKKLTEEEMVEIGSLVLKGSITELREIAKDAHASALKCMMASVAIRTIERGDAHALEILLNRLVGKVKERVELSGPDGGPQVIVSLPSNGREAPKTISVTSSDIPNKQAATLEKK